jgi:hypothetical protein
MNSYDPKKKTTQTTSLYDPMIGFLYAADLFEKDLYREKLADTRHAVQQPIITKFQPTRINP